MANNFKTSQEFRDQYRHGDTFSLNLTEFTTNLTGNAGEKIQLTEVIEVSTIVNEAQGTEQEFILSDGVIRGVFYDYNVEGLYVGADILVEFDDDNESIAATIEGITNDGTDLVLDSVAVTALGNTILASCPKRKDIVIKVTDAPEVLTYKYGINPNDRTSPNYASPLDGADQSYQLEGITGSFTQMRFSGKEQGSSMGVVKIKFNATRESYKHEFELTHEFVIPYFTDGQFSNIESSTNPENLKRNNSVKYGNGFFFGGKRINNVSFEDVGEDGNVGYFGDNFNGFEGFYGAVDFVVTNSLGTGKLEATVPNTVTFSITTNTPIGFVGSEQILLYHSKLPNSVEYSNQRDSFDTVWIRDQIRQVQGDPAVASGIFSAVTVTLNLGKLDVSAVITYTPDQQDLLSDNTAAGITFTIATQRLDEPDNVDKSNVSALAGQTSKDEQVGSLVTLWQPTIYKHSEFASGVAYTDLNGWNGDLSGEGFSFKTDVTQGARISKAIFRIVADNGTSFFQLFSQNIPIPAVNTTTLFGEEFQILDIGYFNSFNLPTNQLINQVTLKAILPLAPATEQVWVGGIGFQVPWQDWIENLAVPPTFVDYNEPNNNLNKKTSNYSGVSGYDIKTILTIVVQNDVGPDTEYDLLSDSSVVSDYGADVGTFVKNYRYFDSNGERSDLNKKEDTRVEIELDHSEGTLVVGDLEALVWMIPKESTAQPYFLSSVDNYLVSNSTLIPTDTLTAGNSTLLEVVSVLNKVTLIFEVDHTKINVVDQKIYCSLKPV